MTVEFLNHFLHTLKKSVDLVSCDLNAIYKVSVLSDGRTDVDSTIYIDLDIYRLRILLDGQYQVFYVRNLNGFHFYAVAYKISLPSSLCARSCVLDKNTETGRNREKRDREVIQTEHSAEWTK